jgi:hypothetical protein
LEPGVRIARLKWVVPVSPGGVNGIFGVALLYDGRIITAAISIPAHRRAKTLYRRRMVKSLVATWGEMSACHSRERA